MQVENVKPELSACRIVNTQQPVRTMSGALAGQLEVVLTNLANDALPVFRIDWEDGSSVDMDMTTAPVQQAASIFKYTSARYSFAASGMKAPNVTVEDGQGGRSTVSCPRFEVETKSCYDCSACVERMQAFANYASGLAVKSAAAISLDFSAYCQGTLKAVSSSSSMAGLYSSTTCDLATQLIAASYSGNLARRPSALCKAAGICTVSG